MTTPGISACLRRLRAFLGLHRTPLAWRNVTHKKPAMAISAGAVSFAVLIMFMELGFLKGLYDSQTALARHLRADLVMISATQHTLTADETFPLTRLEAALGFPGVKNVAPVYLEDMSLRNPSTGVEQNLRVIAFDLNKPVFDHPDIERQVDRLSLPRTLLYDSASRSLLGPVREGSEVELGRRKVAITGTFKLGADYFYDGNAVTSADTLFSLLRDSSPQSVSLGVIQLDDEADQAAVLASLRRALRGDVEILSRAEIISREESYWRKSTAAGSVFTLGVVVGFIIGVIITYQILYTDISDHLPQLATMKAIGYNNRDVLAIVLKQGVMIGIMGFIPAVVLTFALYAGLTTITSIQTVLTLPRIGLVFGLTMIMCLASGLLAARRALSADPADLF